MKSMKIRITKETDSHDENPNYCCFTLDFDETDTNFHFSPHPNWMPTEDQMLTVNQVFLDMSPTFKRRLQRQQVVNAWLDGSIQTQKLINLMFRKRKFDISDFM